MVSASETGRASSQPSGVGASEPTPEVSTPSGAARGARLDGIDVARAVALVGMVTVHFGPSPVDESGALAFFYGSFYGKASVLFVVVAGMGITLMARTYTDREVRARLVYRSIWLLPIGLFLQTLDHPVAVILQYYALYFLFAAPFVGRSSRALVAWAAGLLAVGSAIVLTAQVRMPESVVPLTGGEPAFGVPGELVVFGYYPLVTWLSPMLAGIALARLDLSSTRVRAWMVGVGATTLAATTAAGSVLAGIFDLDVAEQSWGWIASTEGHSEMPLAVIGATGFAVAVIGLSLLLADRWPRVLWPLTALGRLALSVYVGHLIVYHFTPELFLSEVVAEGTRTVLAFTAVTSIMAMAWLALASRGPLELAVRGVWSRVIRPAVATRTSR